MMLSWGFTRNRLPSLPLQNDSSNTNPSLIASWPNFFFPTDILLFSILTYFSNQFKNKMDLGDKLYTLYKTYVYYVAVYTTWIHILFYICIYMYVSLNILFTSYCFFSRSIFYFRHYEHVFEYLHFSPFFQRVLKFVLSHQLFCVNLRIISSG